jgi:hypothetical protein
VRYVGDQATTAQMLTITYIVLGVSGGLWVMFLIRALELIGSYSLMLVSQKQVIIPAQPIGWSLLGILLVSLTCDFRY